MHRSWRVVALSALLSFGTAAVLAVTLSDEPDGAYRAWADHLQQVAGDEADAPAGEEDTAVAEALLLVVTDEDGKGSAFAVVSEAEDGSALLAVVPGSLYELLPGYGIFPIADALTFEGPQLAALAVENTLGIDVGAEIAVAASDLAELIGADVVVNLPNPLLDEEEDGTIVRLAAEGDLLRDPQVLDALFTNRGSGELLAYLERQVAAWEGLVAHVAADDALAASVAARASGDSALAASLISAAGTGLEVTLVPVGQVGGGEDEGFQPKSDEMADFVERRMPQLALWSGERPRAEILNGNGRLTTTREVAEILVGRGLRVVRTDNAESFDFESTVVLAQGEEHTDLARQVVTMLGTGELRLEAEAPSGIVDVSIIVGHDIPTGGG